jgi:ATP-dependent helicase/nuclease subunit A
MRRAPTPEQLEAISTRAPEVLLEAGAGTGKTGVLVDRYCDLIELDGLGPEEILAFTFTDRAGAQLRERVRAELGRRMRDAEEETAERLGALLDELGGAWITTIHGFCRRLLASHPVAAGIDPSFRVLDRAESQRAARNAFDLALDDFLASDDEARETTVAAYGIEGLRAAVVGAHEELRSSGEAEPQLPEPPKSDLQGVLAALERSAAEALAEGGATAGQKAKLERAIELASSRAQRIPDVDQLIPLSIKKGFAGYLAALGKATAAVAEHDTGRQTYDHMADLMQLFGQRFAQSKAERSGLDFEDLQLLAVRLLRGNTAVRESYAERFKHLLVDEFQDTNALQLELIEALRGAQGSVFFVGDEFQSIYGFRHADVAVFRREREQLRSRLDDAVLPLSGNFRSRPEVIATANRVGELMLPDFRPLTVGSAEQGEGGPPGGGSAVELLLTEEKGWDEFDLELPVDDSTAPKVVAEARFLAERLRQLAEAGVPRGEMVVLLRAFTKVDAYEEALERAGLRPYVVGGRGYWSGQQVGDVLCLLRVIANPLDDEALLGALSSPACGVSPDALWLLRQASGGGRHLWPALQRAVGAGEPTLEEPQWLDHVPSDDQVALEAIHSAVAELREVGTRLPLERLLERTLTLSGYDLSVLMRGPGRMRMANVRKLMRMAREFESAEGRNLRSFLEFAEFRAGLDDEPVAATETEDHDGVRVMTIHNAKGLEFEVVAVPSLDRRLLSGGAPPPLRISSPEDGQRKVGMRLTRLGRPSVRLFDLAELVERDDLLSSEEERRLIYVAVTRARRRLILSGVRPQNPKDLTKPGASALDRLLGAPGVGAELADGDVVTLPAPAPRTGLSATFDDAEVLVRVNSPSKRRVAELIASSSAPAPQPPAGEGSPPILVPGAPPTPLRPLSYSALQAHSRCGFRFYSERVLGLQPPPAREGETAASRSERFGFGSAVHALLEWSGSRRWIEPPAEMIRRFLEAEGVEATAELVEAAAERVRGWTASALCDEIGGRSTRVRAELPLLLELGGAVIRGSIDLMAEPASGPPIVIDYKTDRLRGKSPSERAGAYETQRMLYALAASEATGAENVRVAYVFLEAPSDPVIHELGPDEVRQARVLLEQQVAAIAAGSYEVTANPDWPLCHDCPARRRLCSGPAAAPEPEPESAAA